MSETGYHHLREIGREFGVEIHRPGAHQLHFMVQSPAQLFGLCSRLRAENCYLVSVIANDERELEDDCFKIYYFFSHPVDNVFVAVEYNLPPGREIYPSIHAIYPSVETFEREIADLLGLLPEQKEPRVFPQAYLHGCYPVELSPLRRDRSQEVFERLLRSGIPGGGPLPGDVAAMRDFFLGELIVPVGPIHAGVIEPVGITDGYFEENTAGGPPSSVVTTFCWAT